MLFRSRFGIPKSATKMNIVLKYVIGLEFKTVMQNFAAIRSAVLEKMTFEVAFFGNFPDISELKLSLTFWVMEGQMWRCETVRLEELAFLYFL